MTCKHGENAETCFFCWLWSVACAVAQARDRLDTEIARRHDSYLARNPELVSAEDAHQATLRADVDALIHSDPRVR